LYSTNVEPLAAVFRHHSKIHNRMLVIVSDLHLSDGSTANNVDPSVFTDILFPEIVLNALKDRAKEIRIVLLGDILDLVRTDYWARVERDERPWNGSLDPRTAMNVNPKTLLHYEAILRDILSKPWTRALTSEISGLRGKLSRELPDLPVRVSYVIGNHDRVLVNYPSLKEMIAQTMTDIDDLEFPPSVIAPEYGVLARHGHEWDEDNHGYEFLKRVLQPGAAVDRFSEESYRVQTIGEAVTAELIAGLISELSKSTTFAPALIEKIKDVNNVRPVRDAIRWLEWMARNTLTDPEKSVVVGAFIAAVERVVGTGIAHRWGKIKRDIPLIRGDFVDKLQELLFMIRHASFDALRLAVSIYNSFDRLMGSGVDDFVRGAKEEWERGLPDEIQYIVYGHTHNARTDFFRETADGRVRMYINTGTYLPLIEQCEGEGFASINRMTMTFFYRVDETGKKRPTVGPSVEIWDGRRRKTYR
jgi:UDP-2,3-diacylglucosamine pyrophosphatase LpxH